MKADRYSAGGLHTVYQHAIILDLEGRMHETGVKGPHVPIQDVRNSEFGGGRGMKERKVWAELTVVAAASLSTTTVRIHDVG